MFSLIWLEKMVHKVLLVLKVPLVLMAYKVLKVIKVSRV